LFPTPRSDSISSAVGLRSATVYSLLPLINAFAVFALSFPSSGATVQIPPVKVNPFPVLVVPDKFLH
jgi:hypothetical protein